MGAAAEPYILHKTSIPAGLRARFFIRAVTWRKPEGSRRDSRGPCEPLGFYVGWGINRALYFFTIHSSLFTLP